MSPIEIQGTRRRGPGIPDPADWQTAFDSRDMRGTQPDRDTAEPVGAIRAWYEANTGHDASLTYEATTATNGSTGLSTSWLNARLGNGRVSFADGRWLVERYIFPGQVRFQTNNITLRNSQLINAGGAEYGLQGRSLDGNPTGIVVEHCTLNGNYDDDFASAAINFNIASEPNQITIRNCDIYGYRAGLYCFAGTTVEYNWVHDLNFTIDPVSGDRSHNTPASIRGGNTTVRRNLLTDGNSSATSCYPEHSTFTGVLIEENCFRLQASDDGVEVLHAMDRPFSIRQPGETRVLRGNLFYRGGNRGEGGGITDGVRASMSEISGNFDRMGEAVT
ncbi:hypothetical protein [Arthrobacter sp. Alg241-R88]|uniref:hypothetical protein n=1 Tax=Arthrobacter sp. Alg241-R88 TaxID=2305984 RepID=UPI0013D00764|nr:hypothetical protein [Arthrobacter sp. Alg241-R88]